MFRIEDDAARKEAPEEPPKAAGKPVEIARVVHALRRARFLVVGVGVVGAVAGVALATAAAPVEYESHATLVWEPDEVEMADRQRAEKTLIDSIEIPTILASIREKADLPMTVEQVGKLLDVTSTPQSNVLVLAAKSDDPETARRIADAAVETLLEQRERLYRARALDEGGRLDADLSRARATAEKARAELLAFRREKGLVDASAETQTAIESVAKLRGEADAARADADAEAARADTLRGRARKEGERTVLSERVVHPAAVKLAETRADHASLGAQLSSEHPKVQALDSAETALTDSARTEGRGATAEQTIGRNPQWDVVQESLVKAEADESALRKRHDAYRDLASAAEKRLGELGEIEGRASGLLATVNAAEKRLDELELAAAKAHDAAESPKAGLRILVPADLPGKPSKSLRKPVAIAIPIVAVVLALIGVLLRTLWGLRAHTANEVAFAAGLPVVATSTWPVEKELLDELAGELLDAAPGSVGDVAVLGFSQAEVSLASKLARRLSRRVSARDGRDGQAHSFETSSRPLERNHPEVRRLARRAPRVLVVVRSGAHSLFTLRGLEATVGRGDAVAVVVVGLPTALAALPDRAGGVESFWREHCKA